MRARAIVLGSCLAVLAMVSGCGGDPAQPNLDFEVIEEVEFAASLGIDLAQMTKLGSGVYYRDLTIGNGDAIEYGKRAVVTFVGFLPNGQQFDQGGFDFLMGNNEVIPGIELGILGVQLGGTRRIIVPPILGYGASAAGEIPAGSVLIFDLTLTEIR